MQVKYCCVEELSLVETTEYTLLLVIKGGWLEFVNWIDLEVGKDIIEHYSNCVIASNVYQVIVSKYGWDRMHHIILN